MCGFSGIFSIDGKQLVNKNAILSMTKAISHRGPDEENFYIESNIHLGFRRLSIIDIRNGSQPMKSINGNQILCFNGEIYNYKSLKKILISKGISLKTSSDTEVLLEAFSLWGIRCLDYLRGMFSFIIYEKNKNKLTLVRDRLGIKPLFYTIKNKILYFSSEIKGLIDSNEVSLEANNKAISSYLTFRYPIGSGTFFKNIHEVNPGEIMEFYDNKITVKKYWTIPIKKKQEEDLGEDYYLNDTIDLLQDTCKIHLESDVPISGLLSGGLDSSVIMSIINNVRNKKETFRTFSASFDNQDYDELAYANKVAKLLNLSHHNINLNYENYISDLTNIIVKRSVPLSIPHEVALFQLFKKIKNYSKVVISGEGADELFGGYGRVQSSAFDYKKILFMEKKIPKFMHKYFLKLFLNNQSYQRYPNVNEHANHFLSIYNWIPLEQKKDLLTKDFMNSVNYDKEIKNFWSKEFELLNDADPYDRILHIFQKHHLRCLLDRLDNLSMASGVEARVPFVDHELVERIIKMPYKYKFKWKSKISKFMGLFNTSFQNSENKDISKYLLRLCGKKYLPDEIAFKKKLGFPVPLDDKPVNHIIKGFFFIL